MRLGTVIVLAWLAIGVLAGAQRHYFSFTAPSCARAGTVAITILAGPLNYAGVNPRVTCGHPKASG